jgi:DNA-directed RNA polymerase subunit RPC12/RpoP
MMPFCPTCGRFVLGALKDGGKTFCPHCNAEIVVEIRNKFIFVILFIFASLPFLLIKYLDAIFDIGDLFFLCLVLYLFIIFLFSIWAVAKNVNWGSKK